MVLGEREGQSGRDRERERIKETETEVVRESWREKRGREWGVREMESGERGERGKERERMKDSKKEEKLMEELHQSNI